LKKLIYEKIINFFSYFPFFIVFFASNKKTFIFFAKKNHHQKKILKTASLKNTITSKKHREQKLVSIKLFFIIISIQFSL